MLPEEPRDVAGQRVVLVPEATYRAMLRAADQARQDAATLRDHYQTLRRAHDTVQARAAVLGRLEKVLAEALFVAGNVTWVDAEQALGFVVSAYQGARARAAAAAQRAAGGVTDGEAAAAPDS
jgi:hypothetical protein